MAANGSLQANQAASPVPPAPAFSLPGGVYTNDVTVQLATSRGVVRYTTDGSEPTPSSSTYRSPLVFTNSVLVRAKAFDPALGPGATVSQAYTLLGNDLLEFHSNLPLVIINTYDDEFSTERESRLVASTRFIAPTNGRATLTGAGDFDGRAAMNVRGHSSRRYPKHSYGLRFLDEEDEKAKSSVLGFPKESEWVLYAPYPDKTLLRDVLAYEMSSRMGRWAPRTRFVEVFVNQGGGKLTLADYAGVYVFEDKITRDKNRLDIAKLQPDDLREPAISGGYIFKKDHFGRGQMARAKAERARALHQPAPADGIDLPSGPGGFPADPAGFLPGPATAKTVKGEAKKNVRRRPAETATEAYEPITNFVGRAAPNGDSPRARARNLDDEEVFPDEDGFWTGVEGNHFFYVEPEPDELTALQRAWLKDYMDAFETALYGYGFRDPTKGYTAFIDPGSFIDHHIMVEVTKNVDGFRFSTFFQKDRGGKLKMEPVWDMNLTFGNASTRQGWLPEQWLWPQLDDTQYSWFRRLFTDPDFAQGYVDRWAALRTNAFATSNLLARVDQLAALLEQPQQRNFTRWPILGTTVTPNHFVGTNYADEVRFLKTWLGSRLDWMDKQFVPAPLLSTAPVAEQCRLELASAAPPGKIYYTLDGTDPRAPGGEPAAQARLYATPVTCPNTGRVTARIRLDTRWSAPRFAQLR